jgi:predicted  nucleic acid-binding Zn-ribbon protein
MNNRKEISLEDVNTQLMALIKAYSAQNHAIQQLKNKISKMENTIISLQARKSQ